MRRRPRNSRAASLLLGAAAILAPAAAPAVTITAQASVFQTTLFAPPFLSGGDSAGGSSQGITDIEDSAAFGGGEAHFLAAPTLGIGSIGGSSAVIPFDEFRFYGHESDAQAFFKITGEFTVQGDFDVPVGGLMSVDWGGTLYPNDDFEARHAAAFGPTITARASANLAFGTPGNLNQSYTQNVVANQDVLGGDQFGRLIDSLFMMDDTHRTFAFDLTVGGFGSRGGGFDFGARARVVPGLAPASADEGFLDTSFFEIVLKLPPGVSVTSDVPYLRAVTVPEPPVFALLGAALVFVVWRSARRRRDSGRRS